MNIKPFLRFRKIYHPFAGLSSLLSSKHCFTQVYPLASLMPCDPHRISFHPDLYVSYCCITCWPFSNLLSSNCLKLLFAEELEWLLCVLLCFDGTDFSQMSQQHIHSAGLDKEVLPEARGRLERRGGVVERHK